MDSGRELLLEFLDLLNSAMHIEKLIQLSCDFFYNKFRLSNCSILYGDIRHAQNALSPEALAVCHIIEKQVMESNTFLIINHPKSDVLLQDIQSRDKINCFLLSFPIGHKGKAEGACIFYSNENLSSQVELISNLLSKLSVAVSRAQYFEDAKHYAITDVLTGNAIVNFNKFENYGAIESSTNAISLGNALVSLVNKNIRLEEVTTCDIKILFNSITFTVETQS
ncbi:MAG: hypothetical protein QW666_03035 [Candidatus Woesearchaeota archaeon]